MECLKNLKNNDLIQHPRCTGGEIEAKREEHDQGPWRAPGLWDLFAISSLLLGLAASGLSCDSGLLGDLWQILPLLVLSFCLWAGVTLGYATLSRICHSRYVNLGLDLRNTTYRLRFVTRQGQRSRVCFILEFYFTYFREMSQVFCSVSDR